MCESTKSLSVYGPQTVHHVDITDYSTACWSFWAHRVAARVYMGATRSLRAFWNEMAASFKPHRLKHGFIIMEDTAFKTCTPSSLKVLWSISDPSIRVEREKKIPSSNLSCFFSCTYIRFPLVTPCTQQSVNCFTCWTLCVFECRPLGTHAIWLFTSFSLSSFPPAAAIWTHSLYFLKHNSTLVMCGSVWWLIIEHCVMQ